jgi:hypothetical protein
MIARRTDIVRPRAAAKGSFGRGITLIPPSTDCLAKNFLGSAT